MAQPDILGVEVFANGSPSPKNWWEWTLIIIIAVSAAIGLVMPAWYLLRFIRNLFKVRASVTR
jgi:hypothetical protein